nr:TonB-dependent receptor [Oceanicoccus sp. KOV_DT_Chl]
MEYAYDRFEADQNPTMLAITESESFANIIPSLYPVIQAATSSDRPDSIANNSSNASDVDIEGHTLILTYDITDTAIGDLTFKSITGYRDLYTLSQSDFDGTHLDLFRFNLENEFEQTTQEFQLLGTSEQLKYTVGLFYYEDQWDTDNPRWTFQFGGNDFDTSKRGAKDESIAAFGQLTWTPGGFDNRLDLTGGLRWTRETKDVYALWQDISIYNTDLTDPNAGVYLRDSLGNPVFDSNGELIPMEAKDTWEEVTPMAVASWRFNENINGYAKISTGFKSGGFDGVATNNASFRRGFDPEEMTTYEVGLKSRLADNRVQLNMSYFYNDYENFQAGLFLEEVVGTVVLNAGEASMQGVEIELTARPSTHLELSLNYGWLDTEYQNFKESNGVDISNDRFFAYSPEQTVFASAKYTFDPFSIGTLALRLDYSWTDDYFVTITDDPTTNVDAFGLLSARAELTEIAVGNSHIRVAAWGKNLTDEEYWNAAINLSVYTVNQWADPRSYGLEIAFDF